MNAEAEKPRPSGRGAVTVNQCRARFESASQSQFAAVLLKP